MRRTSFSISQKQYTKLREASEKFGLSQGKLAMLCLQRLVKRAIRISKNSTIAYNRKASPHRVYYSLSSKTHSYLQTIRLSEKVSISYLVTIAIARYLKKVLEKLQSKRARQPRFVEGYHFIVPVDNSRITGLRIVMLKPPKLSTYLST